MELHHHILHHDTAPTHKSGMTLRIIANFVIDFLTPLANLPDVASFDYQLFPKLQSQLSKEIFQTREDLISAVHEQLDLLKPSNFQHCFGC